MSINVPEHMPRHSRRRINKLFHAIPSLPIPPLYSSWPMYARTRKFVVRRDHLIFTCTRYSHYAIVYPEQTSCAQHHSPNFTLNDIDAVSSPLLSSLGYLPLPVLFNATSSLPMTLPNALSPPDGGNGPNFFSFSAAGAPSPGAADYKEATQFNILNSAIGGVFIHIVKFHDH